MPILMLIPATLTAVGVVREKEVGSIADFRATAATRPESLLGKQSPYVVLSFFSFLLLLAAARFLFGLPVSGSVAALVLGAFLYIFAAIVAFPPSRSICCCGRNSTPTFIRSGLLR